MKKTRVTHIITGLGGGGAEAMLFKLLENTDRQKFDVNVISMLDKGIYGERIEKELIIPVHKLNFASKKSIIKGTKEAFKICRNTDVIQTWMYHANLFGFIIGKVLRKKIIWGLHHSDLSKGKNKISTVAIAKIGGKLSRYVTAVVSCGDMVKKVHLEIGYAVHNNVVIPNGFDTSKFSPEMKSNELKRQLEIVDDKKLILHVARWHALKDYKNLICSVRELSLLRQDFVFLLVGKDISHSNTNLVNMIKENKVEEFICLLGRSEAIPVLMATADVFVSSSSGEGFPNVIGEAMASGTYCVVTDAGDSKNIVGRYGKVVPTKDHKSLAKGINEVLNMESKTYTQETNNARERVIRNFDIKYITKSYEELY